MGKRGPKPGTGGRPRKDADPQVKKQLVNYRMLGAPVEQCATLTGIDTATIYRWMEQDENFCETFKNARENALYGLENTLFKKAMAGDTTSLIFALKTQRREKYAERLDINQMNRHVWMRDEPMTKDDWKREFTSMGTPAGPTDSIN